jgi:hypothetical protein
MLTYESFPIEDSEVRLDYLKKISKTTTYFQQNSLPCFGDYAYCYRNQYKPNNIFAVSMFFTSYVKEYINKFNETYKNIRLNFLLLDEDFIEIKITDTCYKVPYFNYAKEENVAFAVKEHNKTSFGRKKIDVLEKNADIIFSTIQIELNPEYNEQAKFVLYLLNGCALREFSWDCRKTIVKRNDPLDSLIKTNNYHRTPDGFSEIDLDNCEILDRMNNIELMNRKFYKDKFDWPVIMKFSRYFQHLQKLYQTDLIKYILL